MVILLRALVAWLLALGLTLLVSIGALCLGFGNFVVAWQSFTAQGYEQTPLGQVPLLGVWAEGFGVGDAPLAALYALMLTLGMNIVIVVTAELLARALRCFFDRRQALRSDDPIERANAAAYRDRAVHLSMLVACFVIASILVIRFDVAQFRFRYENLFTGTTDPTDVLGWAPDPVARLGHYLADFIGTATWGYVALVIALALAVEYTIGRAAERWYALTDAFDSAVAPDAQAFPITGGSLPSMEQSPAGNQRIAEEVPSFGEVTPAETVVMRDSTMGIDPAPVSPPTPVPPPAGPTPREEGALVDVIVGPGRSEALPLAEVQADRERFIRDGSGRAWFLREYWEQVIGNGGRPEGAP